MCNGASKKSYVHGLVYIIYSINSINNVNFVKYNKRDIINLPILPRRSWCVCVIKNVQTPRYTWPIDDIARVTYYIMIVLIIIILSPSSFFSLSWIARDRKLCGYNVTRIRNEHLIVGYSLKPKCHRIIMQPSRILGPMFHFNWFQSLVKISWFKWVMRSRIYYNTILLYTIYTKYVLLWQNIANIGNSKIAYRNALPLRCTYLFLKSLHVHTYFGLKIKYNTVILFLHAHINVQNAFH